MRPLICSLLTAVALLVGAAPARAQCTPYGQPCNSSGMQLVCSTAPQIGTTWRIGERSAMACGLSSSQPGTIFTVYGLCFPPGVPIGTGLACNACGGCFLHVLPSLGAIGWTWPPRTHDIPIPGDPGLLGATFCMQDVCIDRTAVCVCLSQAIQVMIQ